MQMSMHLLMPLRIRTQNYNSMEEIIKIIKSIGYSHWDCILIPFAGKVYPETEELFKNLLAGIAKVEVMSRERKQWILITPIIK